MTEDPTSRAFEHFARVNGFGSYVAVNLYPYRSSNPRECRRWADYEKNGPDWCARDALMDNQARIASACKNADRVVACWGAIAHDENWVEAVVDEIQQGVAPYPDIYCLGTTLNGSPIHPMARGRYRIARDQKFLMWKPNVD